MSPGKIVLLVLGIIGVLVASGLLAGGGALVWIDRTVKDSEGYYTAGNIDVQRDSYAVISQPAEINVRGLLMGDWTDLATFKVEGRNNNNTKGTFIGIAPEQDARRYLLNVEHDEVTEFDIHPYEIDYRTIAGELTPDSPAEQTFWTDSAYGPGEQKLEWELESGTYILVMMNEDGSKGIDLTVEVGAKIPGLIWVGVGFLIGGVFALVIAGVLIYIAVRRS